MLKFSDIDSSHPFLLNLILYANAPALALLAHYANTWSTHILTFLVEFNIRPIVLYKPCLKIISIQNFYLCSTCTAWTVHKSVVWHHVNFYILFRCKGICCQVSLVIMRKHTAARRGWNHRIQPASGSTIGWGSLPASPTGLSCSSMVSLPASYFLGVYKSSSMFLLWLYGLPKQLKIDYYRCEGTSEESFATTMVWFWWFRHFSLFSIAPIITACILILSSYLFQCIFLFCLSICL